MAADHRSGPPDTLPQLGELELAVLDQLWSAGDTMDVRGMHGTLGEARGISANTVGSALERLHRKGLLQRTKRSHAYWYEPALSRDAFHARRVLAAAEGVENLRREGFLAAFVDTVADADDEALDRLQALVRERLRRGEP